MKLGIMQPYFLPYIGYFQLLNAVDKYVIYDNIQYTKKGWINRNRILQNGKDTFITLPLEKDSDYLDIRERSISQHFDKNKLLNPIKESYRKSPCYIDVIVLVENIINFNDNNLFNFIYHSISQICSYLDIKTEIIVSSGIGIDHSLKGKEKVISICKTIGAKNYINAIGGKELYSVDEFEKENISLRFLKTKPIEYKQFDNEFISNLSILDVLMFNPVETVKKMLGEYSLISKFEN